MPNKISRFWQELKRRKVIRVITVYTAVSLAILELVSNISEPFGLPGWTLKFIFVILIIGLILSVILSWIYDVHPEEGVIKTEPAQPDIKGEKTPSSTEARRSVLTWKSPLRSSLSGMKALMNRIRISLTGPWKRSWTTYAR